MQRKLSMILARFVVVPLFLISLLISGCGQEQVLAPTLTPGPTLTPSPSSTPTTVPEDIIRDALETACQGKPAASPRVGASTIEPARARLCAQVASDITLPEKWTATTPEELSFVVNLKEESSEDSCGPYRGSSGPFGSTVYITRWQQAVVIELISAKTGEVIDQAKVAGAKVECPLKITGTGDLTGEPVPAQAIRGAIVNLISPLAKPRILEPDIFIIGASALAPDGELLAMEASDGTVQLWDMESGKLSHTVEGHTNSVDSLAFSPDGELLASASRDRTVKLWERTTGNLVRTVRSNTRSVFNATFTPDGKLLALSSEQGVMEVWDVAEGTLLSTLESDRGNVFTLAFSPDAKRLAPGFSDGTIELWDVTEGTLLRTLESDHGAIDSLAFSPDGKLLACGSSDGTIQLWDMTAGSVVNTLAGHTDRVINVVFSPDGKSLASASFEGTFQLWDVTEGAVARTFKADTGGDIFHGSAELTFPTEDQLLALWFDIDQKVQIMQVELP